MSSSTKTTDTRQQLRNLMQQHTATTFAPAANTTVQIQSPTSAQVRPQAAIVSPPASSPLVGPTSSPPRPIEAGDSGDKTGGGDHRDSAYRKEQGDRRTIRLSAQELDKVNRLTLETHQRIGERITTSDVLRIGLARVGQSAPITSDEIGTLRSTDRRRRLS